MGQVAEATFDTMTSCACGRRVASAALPSPTPATPMAVRPAGRLSTPAVSTAPYVTGRSARGAASSISASCARPLCAMLAVTRVQHPLNSNTAISCTTTAGFEGGHETSFSPEFTISSAQRKHMKSWRTYYAVRMGHTVRATRCNRRLSRQLGETDDGVCSCPHCDRMRGGLL